MTRAADLLLSNAEVHTLVDPDLTHEAVAVRDGRIVRVGDASELAFLVGVETRRIDLAGRVLLPGFVDAHTHLTTTGRRLVHADLAGASDREECVARLRERAAELGVAADSDGVPSHRWVLGFGYDESTWDDRRYLRRDDLDDVTDAAPVAAVREDMHVISLNSVALDRLGDDLPPGDVRREGSEPTGVVVEVAADAVYRSIEPDLTETRDLLRAAQSHANALGVTGVHDMVRRSHAPRAYRDLERTGDLSLRVRLNYWSVHLDALTEAGVTTNHGTDLVRVGAIKTYTDGSIGGRTAKLSAPYDDWDAESDSGDTSVEGDRDDTLSGTWVVPPDEFRTLVERAEQAGFQVAAHAIGDVAIDAVLDVFGDYDSGEARHRIEHVELATDAAIRRLAELGVVASMQPNFHRWAGEGRLYESRLGDRWPDTNRLGRMRDAGVRLAFGSDCMPLDPLYGVHQAVNAPTEAQRLDVTDALRAYTSGAAYAGFDEDRLGTIEVGKRADLVVLDRSPWEYPGEIEGIEVAMTVVDGNVVYDGR